MTALGPIAQLAAVDGADVPTGTNDAGDPYWSVPVALPPGYVDNTVIPAGALVAVVVAATWEAAGDTQSVTDSQAHSYTQVAELDLTDALEANVTIWTTVTETDLDPATDTVSFSFLAASYTALSDTLFWSLDAVWVGPGTVVGVADDASDVAGGAITVLPDVTATALTSRDTTFLAVEVVAEPGVGIADFADEVIADGTFEVADIFLPSVGTPTEGYAVRLSTLEDEVTAGTYTPADGPDWAVDGPTLSYGVALFALREFNTVVSTVRPEDPVSFDIVDYIATATERLISDVSFGETETFVTGDITEDDQAIIDAAIAAYIASLPVVEVDSPAFLELRDELIPALAAPGDLTIDERERNQEKGILDVIEMLIEPPTELNALREAVLATPRVAPRFVNTAAAIEDSWQPPDQDLYTVVPGMGMEVVGGTLYQFDYTLNVAAILGVNYEFGFQDAGGYPTPYPENIGPLPVLPDPAWPLGSFVYFVPDVYENQENVWVNMGPLGPGSGVGDPGYPRLSRLTYGMLAPMGDDTSLYVTRDLIPIYPDTDLTFPGVAADYLIDTVTPPESASGQVWLRGTYYAANDGTLDLLLAWNNDGNGDAGVVISVDSVASLTVR